MVWKTRTGYRSRFLIYPGAEFTAVTSEFLFWNVLFGWLPLLVVVWLCWSTGSSEIERLWHGTSAYQQLARPLPPGEAGGRVRLSGVLRLDEDHHTAAAAPFALCYVLQQEQSGKSTRTLWSGNLLADGAYFLHQGTRYTLDPARIDWSPEERRNALAPARWRALLSLPDRGWLHEQCVAVDEPIHLEACLTEGVLHGCDGEPLYLTPGDGSLRPRLQVLAQESVMSLTLLGIGGLLLMLYAWRVARPRPVVEHLARWGGEMPALSPQEARALYALLIGYGVAVGLWLLAGWLDWVHGGGTSWLLFTLASGAAVLLVFVTRRRRVLGAASQLVKRTAAVSLAQAQHTDQLVSLSLRASASAPTTEGPLTQRPHAWWVLRASRIYKKDKNHEEASYLERHSAGHLAVEDQTGRGLLSLASAALDLRAWRQRRTTADGTRLPAPGQSWAALEFEESVIDPGEEVFVVGRVAALRSAQGGAAFRESAASPVISGAPEQPLVIYAGGAAALGQALRRERLFFGVLQVVLGGFVLGAALLYVWGATR